MPLSHETEMLQLKLVELCKKCSKDNIKNIIDERALTYRSLIKNVINDTLIKAYPITHSILTAKDFAQDNLLPMESLWSSLINSFIADARFEAPELWRMPKGLISFARSIDFADSSGIPFIYDLLEFEWAEIDLFMTSDLVNFDKYADGQINKNFIVINPEHKILILKYPVFRKLKEEQISIAGNYRLLLFRHPTTRLVRFIEISPIFESIVNNLNNLILTRDDFSRMAMNLLADQFPSITANKQIKSDTLKHIRIFIDQAINEGFIYYYAQQY